RRVTVVAMSRRFPWLVAIAVLWVVACGGKLEKAELTQIRKDGYVCGLEHPIQMEIPENQQGDVLLAFYRSSAGLVTGRLRCTPIETDGNGILTCDPERLPADTFEQMNLLVEDDRVVGRWMLGHPGFLIKESCVPPR